MEPQPAMLEIATGESSSSDSITSLSQSGASSISTTHTTASRNNQDLAAQVQQLQEEKKLLEGRIRGYKTLSDLLVESKKENQKLKAKLMELQAKEGATSMQSLSAPGSKDLSHPDISKISLNGTEQTVTSPQATSFHSNGPASLPARSPPECRPPSSFQETTGPPDDSEETKVVSSPNAGANITPASDNSTPMQESLGPLSNMSQAGSGSRDNLTSSPEGQERRPEQSGESSPEMLQLDSDKYDEATYEKVGLRLGMGQSSLTGSMYAAGGNRTDPRPVDFPSLSSGLSGGMVHVHSSNHSSINPPFMGMMHHSYIGQASDAGGAGLAAEVETISERLNSETGDSSMAIASQMHAIAERIARVEQKKDDQKKLIQTLMAENQALKRQVKFTDSSHQAELVALREENTRLMQQLKHSHQGQVQEAAQINLVSPPGDWVHVERPVNMGDVGSGSQQTLVDRVRKLEQEKAELHRANSNWKIQWDQMEQKNQARLLRAEEEVSALKSQLDEQSRDFEARMLDLKRHYSEEEGAKEEAIHQQRLSERKCQELQDQLTELRTQLSDTARDKQALAAELSILKARAASQETQTGGNAASGSKSALEAEIAMLRQQLTVYLEDFEHEREDRTAAQLARDSARKNAESIARMNQQLNSQIRHMQRQIKDRDETITSTLRQNETLQRELANLKKKLATEWEQKQNLQRALTLAQQQLQQQQAQRNPYYMPTMYPATQPLYQPPSSFAQPAQHYPGRPTSQPVSRMGAAAMSPEHLPGAWTCRSCTYVNFPGRTVCDMCGMVNSPRNSNEPFGFMSTENMYQSGEHPLLMSRGNDPQQTGGMTGGAAGGGGDLVTDSGMSPAGVTPH